MARFQQTSKSESTMSKTHSNQFQPMMPHHYAIKACQNAAETATSRAILYAYTKVGGVSLCTLLKERFIDGMSAARHRNKYTRQYLNYTELTFEKFTQNILSDIAASINAPEEKHCEFCNDQFVGPDYHTLCPSCYDRADFSHG